MKEIIGDLWYFHDKGYNIAITTNGTIRGDGKNVMGKGCAKEAQDRYAWLPELVGGWIKVGGNVPLYCGERIFTFPTKYHWSGSASPDLIMASALEIKAMTEGSKCQIIIPRPGCGLGGLKWEEIGKLLAPVFDGDRFLIISRLEDE